MRRCEDAIDRAEAMTEIMMSKDAYLYIGHPTIRISDAVQAIRELPSVNAIQHTSNASKDVEQRTNTLGDAVSREAVLDIINFEDKWLLDAKGHNADTEIAFSGMKSRIAELPSVTPKPTECDDAINRRASIDALKKHFSDDDGIDTECGAYWHHADVIEVLQGMPPVTPKPDNKYRKEAKRWKNKWLKSQKSKTGHWIIIDDCELFMAKCSECGEIVDSRMISKYPYCHCGAKMESEVQTDAT